jgi:hypothetical protein
MACAAPQFLYLKSGKRYDIGSVFFIVVGSLLAGLIANDDPQSKFVITKTLVFLLPLASILFLLRVYALSSQSPMLFTLISIAQMWATIPVLSYCLNKYGTNPSSISVSQVAGIPAVFVISLILCFGSFFTYERMHLFVLLAAATEEPNLYKIYFGSRTAIAIKCELLSLPIYLFAGALFRMVHNNIAADDFGSEALWIIMSVAPMPFSHRRWVAIGPVLIVIIRYILHSYIGENYTLMLGYLCFCIILLATFIFERQTLRIKRA